MRLLQDNEINAVNGAEINAVLNYDVKDLKPFNFSTGFAAGIDLVGGVVGFAMAIPLAFVVLPVRGVIGIYNYVCSN